MRHAVPSNPSPLASRIRAAREAASLKPSDLARLVGATSVSVWRWEFRNQVPGAEHLESIAKHTATSTSWLLHGDEQKPEAAA